ncbi:N-acetyl-gamma-glutamyl-phosphate reductase [Erythrobacter sp. W53]|uniref:N-acetyl-gamma-glutamyl-phosphate reductase n=1 Tax=Erythrobacter sp. W53 TaxID=3425947 RepID=UPI003D76804A
MTHRIFIDGAAGTTGLEILDRLEGRSEFELIRLDNAQRKNEAARRDALNAADVAILCLPDDAARDAVAMIDPEGSTRVVDASSAHRVADGWAYGFPEIIGHEKVANARFVSNPGCYPTGFLALVAPLVRAGLLPADWPYTVNAVSGYSGGGKALIERFEKNPDLAFRAYGLEGDHKHLPEMQKYAGLDHPPVFSPSVIPTHRGMMVDVPLPLHTLGGKDAALKMLACLDEDYENHPMVQVDAPAENPTEIVMPCRKGGWDWLDIHVYADDDFTQLRLVATLDNLGKGASGAAIQNLNIMCGLPETTGLRL